MTRLERRISITFARSLGLFFAFCSGVSAGEVSGVTSPYTLPLTRLAAGLFAKDGSDRSAVKGSTVDAASPLPLMLRCWETPGNDLYIGIEQRMEVNAPLAQVRAVLDDIDHYRDLFPGYKDIHVESRDSNRLETYWEQKIPLFFVPNAKFEMLYRIDSSDPSRVVYQYQLKKPADLKMSDGFVFIGKDGDTKTRYVEYDFFDAEWGAAKILGRDKIWHDTVEGIALSDLAIRLKAENPAWAPQKARSEAEPLLQKNWVDDCVKTHRNFTAPAS